MSDVTDQDEIEFFPSDDVIEPEPEAPGAEEGAVHVHAREEPEELLAVDTDEFDVEALAESDAEELEVEVTPPAGTEEEEEGAEEEREEDLEEVLRRHFGIAEEEPEEAGAGAEPGELRELSSGEFVCRSCFMRRSVSQLSDPAHGICVDCVDDPRRAS